MRKHLTVLFIILRRLFNYFSSLFVKYKYILFGAKIGSHFRVIGNCKIRGWYNNLTIKDHVDIHNKVCILVGHYGSVQIGRKTSISYNTIVNAGAGNIIIGEDSMIAGNCYIVSNDHDIHSTLSVRDCGHIIGDVHIGNNVWIGSNVVITKGVHIGDGAIIGAGSVVTKDIPPMTIAYGVPCKAVSHRILNNEK